MPERLLADRGEGSPRHHLRVVVRLSTLDFASRVPLPRLTLQSRWALDERDAFAVR